MISIEEIARDRGLDNEDVIEFLQDFLEYTEQEDLERLREGLASGDYKKIRSSAHSIKGAALNLKLDEIGSYAEKIEKKSAAEDLSEVPELLNALTERMQVVRDFLKGRS
ncbi:MAG: Hpt domain-containing protein [Desulfomonile sp.]|nr:Hpt domain-containing protein [Deltaproteobacteria bacterium]